MLSSNDMPNSKPIYATNNLTEWMNKSIEGQHIGTQPIIILLIYGVTLVQNNIIEETSPQLIFKSDKLASKHPIAKLDSYYLVNMLTSECTCFDFIWNGSFRDVCKHVHAACLFNDIEDNKVTLDIIKHDLVLYFRNKEHAMLNEQKNFVIYNGFIDIAFQKILQIYLEQGIAEKDLFRPIEMPVQNTLGVGAPK
ncbi:8296_t:CDS:2, partial [Gigaspora rosea]